MNDGATPSAAVRGTSALRANARRNAVAHLDARCVFGRFFVEWLCTNSSGLVYKNVHLATKGLFG